MPTIFSGVPGRVVQLTDPSIPGVLPPLISSPDAPISFQQQKALLTRVVLSRSSNYQFMHTLGGDIFVYVFGDRIGQMTISGLACASRCDVNMPTDNDDHHGIEHMIDWYDANKITARPDPIRLLLGKKTLLGFVTDFTAGVFNHEMFLMNFDITLALLPEKKP